MQSRPGLLFVLFVCQVFLTNLATSATNDFQWDAPLAQTIKLYHQEVWRRPHRSFSWVFDKWPLDSAGNLVLSWCDQNRQNCLTHKYTVTPNQTYCNTTTWDCPPGNTFFTIPDNGGFCVNSQNKDAAVFVGETVEPCADSGVLDVSQSSGIANQNIQTTGVQWIDYNNDSRIDLFLVGNNGTALFRNVGGGKFVNVTEQAKIGNNGRNARGASWADIDNDGDLDVFIANVTGTPTLLLNNRGVFVDISGKLTSPGVTAADSGTTQAGIWFDFNNDKDVDLLIVKDGAPNQLYKKKGLQFTNVASSAGVAVNSSGRSAIAFDQNADGLMDFYVCNFNKPNNLFMNAGNETFRDVAPSAGVAFTGASVQAAVADYDGDKDLDLYLVNNNGVSPLFKNIGNAKFSNATPAALKTPKAGIAAAFIDIDLDGDQDLILAQTAGGNLLFQNKGKGVFAIVKSVDLNNPDNPTGVTIGDFNSDGLPDIAIGDGDASQDRGDSLYQNTGGGGNNHVQITLIGTSSNRAAIGARVIVQTGLTFQAKEVTSGNGQTEGSLPMTFGLGVAGIIDTLQVFWPGGDTTTAKDLPVNSKFVVRH